MNRAWCDTAPSEPKPGCEWGASFKQTSQCRKHRNVMEASGQRPGQSCCQLGLEQGQYEAGTTGESEVQVRECWVIQGHCALPLGIWKAGPCLVTFLTLSLVVTLPTIDRRQKGGVLGRPNDGQPGISRVCSNLTVHMVYVV